MRVGHLRSSDFFGGPERAIVGQCLNMRGPEFACLSFVRRGTANPFLERCRQCHIPTYPIAEFGTGDFTVVWRIRRVVRDQGFDLLVSHDYKSNFMALLALRGMPTGHVRHFRGFTSISRKDLFYNWIDEQNMRRMARVLAVSNRSAEILIELGIRREALTVVPNAIEKEKLIAADSPPITHADRPLRLVAAGRLSTEKGLDVLVRALGEISASVSLTVDVYGDGPERVRLEAMIARLGVAPRITLRGFIDDVLPQLRDADGMVLPSRSEGMPNILLEAWAQKRPVISTAVGGVPEMIDPGVTGLLCPPDSSTELAAQLTWAANNRDEFAAMGQAGYDVVRRRYTYEIQSELLRSIYDEAIARS